MKFKSFIVLPILAVTAWAMATPVRGQGASVLTTLVDFVALNGAGENASGAYPHVGMIQGSDGTLYGATARGGAGGSGLLYKLTPTGGLSSLHTFGAANSSGVNNDGSEPDSRLLQAANGSFFGVTARGGSSGFGTVFKVTPAGELTVLHNFSHPGANGINSDGAIPLARLALGSDGNFYGITEDGGSGGSGTIFKISPKGTLTSLYSFSAHTDGSPNSDGAHPYGGLTQGSDGTFYGTTQAGGPNDTGTIFRISSAGEFASLYGFSGVNSAAENSDGAAPFSALTQGSDGTLYGTTSRGGAGGAGTVFSFVPGGVPQTLYNFDGFDGSFPIGELLLGKDGNFYGTTESGGTEGSNGTAFKITPAGALTVLHSFNGADGAHPEGALLQGSNGNLYGTTLEGGKGGSGTVFELTVVATKLPVVSVIATRPVAHADGGKAGLFTVTLSEARASQTTVKYTLKGSAINGTDYNSLPGKVDIKPGHSSATVKVVPKGTPAAGEVETVKLVLDAKADYTLGANASAKITIKP